MTRIDTVNGRFDACASLARTGVEIITVGDRPGARLDAAFRRLMFELRDHDPEPWADLIGAAKALSWRRLTQPQPAEHNPALRDAAEQVGTQLTSLRGAVVRAELLDDLRSASEAVRESDAPVGGILLRSLEEVGFDACAVVAANVSAQVGLRNWLRDRGVVVMTAAEFNRAPVLIEQAYAVGPPRFFPSSVVTAPSASEISYVMPSWFGDRGLPQSAIAPYAEGAIRIATRVLHEGSIDETEPDVPELDEHDALLPQAAWGVRRSPDRPPASHEVEARKVLLKGGLAMWLDDGDRIRALDPQQPSGERVTYMDVGAVQAGTHLLVRQGETERSALYSAAITLLGADGTAIDRTQAVWKGELAERLAAHGYTEVVRRLLAQDVKTAERARAWIEPNLVRPHSDSDFERLLLWLDIPIQPTFGNATRLRRMKYQVSADVREELERAVSAADLALLERDGYMRLEVDTEGFRGIVATRVLALSPYTEIISRHDARLPFPDRSGQWLE